MTARTTTEEMWLDRVRDWRKSGQTAADFARGQGYAVSTLHWWSSRFGRGGQPGFLRLVPRAPAAQGDAAVVVEVGHARIRVKAGFDTKLLAEVVTALGGDR